MRKLLFTLMLTVVVVTASFYAQVKHIINPEKTISKSVTLDVSAGDAYHAKVYAHSSARLHLTVIKVTGNERKVILEQEYPDLELNKFSSFTHVFNQTINIADVLDSKEQVVINYTITYKTKKSVLKVENEKLISKGKLNEQVSINI